MLKDQALAQSDLIIASRLHMAGNELKEGVARTPRLLALGGIFVGNGPTRYTAGFDYNKVRFEMQRTGKYQIQIDQVHQREMPGMDYAYEENRLVLGVRIKS